ncbi:MAG TPA: patatin-like phospholipase family protein, partial [Chloroflexota bacterium]|nr:patatin-like phospholipase family protein [Chloroflexota bacterium]
DTTTDEWEQSLLDELSPSIEWVQLIKGEYLFHAGDAGDSVYIVMYGRLGITTSDSIGVARSTGEVGRGAAVGELEMLTGQVRSSSIRAIRDAGLARVSREAFERLAERFPRPLTRATDDVVGRLRAAFQPQHRRRPVTSIALVSHTSSVNLADFAVDLAEALRSFGPTLILSQSRLDALFGDNTLGLLEQNTRDGRLVEWLNEVELDYRFVIYQTDQTPSPWTRRCIRQADRILLVAHADEAPVAGVVEAELTRGEEVFARTRCDLILLHCSGGTMNTGDWLALRDVDTHHHVRFGVRDDIDRLARRMAGRAIGLVLGGGGVRASAHIGVIRALYEAGIRIDLIGGTSAGALVAGHFASGRTAEEIRDQIFQHVVLDKALSDYTFPRLSLIAARRYVDALVNMFGETRIEDLLIPFFCVSSNLTRAEVVIHRKGPLWRCVRASCAIPGVMPPVLENGDLLVDGGVLDNLPVRQMASLCDGGPVIAVDLRVKVDMADDFDFGESVSGGTLLWNRLNPFARKKIKTPGIHSVLMRSMLLGSVNSGLAQAPLADLYINPPVGRFPLLDTREIDAMIELGYQTARERLSTWDPNAALERGNTATM